ncbi:unnamed protein product [Ambrosiozyma monospora]|uniref:Unnamed protein product n=1 Tax=Ambrosiozyma monospora TaxID=43982 RepID=A0A9W7DEH1_AMBMO|nr:unnamed protein product [Ambrosiozyma monospora]
MNEPPEAISVKSSFGSDSSTTRNYNGLDDHAEKEIRKLARTLTDNSEKNIDSPYGTASNDLIRTLTSMTQVPGVSPFTGDIDPRLDPSSDEFDSKFWVKNMRKLKDSDPDHYKPTSLGIAYRNLCCKGIASDADFQPTVANLPYKHCRDFYYNWFKAQDQSRYFEILKPMDALIKPGTLTVVLGRPGAGCSTLLRTIAGQTYGFKVDPQSQISYDGLSPATIQKYYKGEVLYCAETEAHIPQLSVGQTLEFASLLRTPQNRPAGVSREEFAKHMTRVYMATYGLSHTYNTKVGDQYIRGVSGGERKRVSLAEVSLCGSDIQCWDNATRGLDSATALEFVKALKTSAMILETTPLIAIYQCSQDAYDLFDNVILLYNGYQIFYGEATKAKSYFERMGWKCPARQTTADFLTSITSPEERVAKAGWEHKVPKSPKEFADYWKSSPEYAELCENIDSHISFCEENHSAESYKSAHIAKQSDHIRPGSPFTVSFWMQIKILALRNFWRLQKDPSVALFTIFGNSIMGLILSSLFYNLKANTATFYYRTAAMFFAVLINAFSSLLEVLALFECKDVIEKHKKYALYHPAANALSSILCDIPVKIATSLLFNLIFYFMVNFRRDPGRFFFFYLISFTATLVMSHAFRTIGSFFATMAESMTPTNLIMVAIVTYAGFALPTSSMLGWSRWINYLDPIAYAFEALLANEFEGRKFDCSSFVPAYPDASIDNKVCSVVSGKAGYTYINGTDYIEKSFAYYPTHKWRNFGICVGFAVFFLFTYLTVVEFSKSAMQKGEKIVFQLSTLAKMKKEQGKHNTNDVESGPSSSEKPPGVIEGNSNYSSSSSSSSNGINKLVASKDIFHWSDVCYEVQIKDETRRILDHVDGWVKPGTLTALMGASGAA